MQGQSQTLEILNMRPQSGFFQFRCKFAACPNAFPALALIKLILEGLHQGEKKNQAAAPSYATAVLCSMLRFGWADPFFTSSD